MRSLFRLSIISAALVGAFAAGVTDAEAQEAGTPVTGEEYFAIASDPRRCAAPMCGGWFLDRLNQPTTTCHDGRSAEACYTPVLDWSQSNLSEDAQAEFLANTRGHTLSGGVHSIVRGRFEPTNSTTEAPEMGRFVITEAWLAVGEPASSDELFVGIRDNGVRCIAAPCPSYTETVLNTATSTDIADIDFSPTALSETEIEEIAEQLFTPAGVLVVGSRYDITIDGRAATGRAATAAYRRLTDAEP